MVKLVLEDPRTKASEGLLVPLKALILILHPHHRRSAHRLAETGETEASLVQSDLLRAILQHLRIDKGVLHIRCLGIGVLEGRRIDDKELQRLAHLRGGQSDPIGGIHSVVHIGNQFLETGQIRSHLLGRFSQYISAVDVYR